LNGIGRPQAYSPEKAAKIISAVRKGLPYKLAAAAGGVSYNTFIRWRNEGSNPSGAPHFRQFLNQLRQAEAEAAVRLLGLIEKSAKNSWQAASWMLERRHPDLFGKDAKPPSKPMLEFEIPISDDD
jgi:transposase